MATKRSSEKHEEAPVVKRRRIEVAEKQVDTAKIMFEIAKGAKSRAEDEYAEKLAYIRKWYSVDLTALPIHASDMLKHAQNFSAGFNHNVRVTSSHLKVSEAQLQFAHRFLRRIGSFLAGTIDQPCTEKHERASYYTLYLACLDEEYDGGDHICSCDGLLHSGDSCLCCWTRFDDGTDHMYEIKLSDDGRISLTKLGERPMPLRDGDDLCLVSCPSQRGPFSSSSESKLLIRHLCPDCATELASQCQQRETELHQALQESARAVSAVLLPPLALLVASYAQTVFSPRCLACTSF